MAELRESWRRSLVKEIAVGVISAVVVAGAGAIWSRSTDGGLIRILGGVTHTQAEAIAKRIAASNALEKLANAGQRLSDYYANTGQQLNAERHQTERASWLNGRPTLVFGPGCNLSSSSVVPCDVVPKGETAPVAALSQPAQPDGHSPARTVDVCKSGVPVISAADSNPVLPAPPPPPAPPASAAPPATQVAAISRPSLPRPVDLFKAVDLFRALSNYSGALAALAAAQDIAALDNVAARLRAAISSLAQSAGPQGAAAALAPLTSTKTSWWLSLLGQDDLDNRRLEQLKTATEAACEPIHVLTDAMGLLLESQQQQRLFYLYELLALKIRSANIAKAHTTNQEYGATIDEVQAAADAFNAVHAANLLGTAQAFSSAHDALVVAVRNNDGRFSALTANLQAFAERADELTAAIASTKKL